MQITNNLSTIQQKKSGWKYSIQILSIIGIILGLRYQYFLLKYLEWGDESETIVTAKMMAAGQSLYSEIFNHHGPLTFLPGLVIEYFGDYGIREHRIPIALLQILSLCAIYYSPIFKSRTTQIFSVACAAGVIAFHIPDFLGHMYAYQSITGPLVLIILAIYTLPSIINPGALTKIGVIAGSFAISCLPFLAITYIPAAAIFFVTSLARPYLRLSVTATLLGTLLNIIFILIYGSIEGYAAFHFYLNSEILPQYIGTPTLLSIIISAWNSALRNPVVFIYILITTTGLATISWKDGSVLWRPILLTIGIGSLLIRGAYFQGLPFYYASIGASLPLIIKMEKHIFSLKYITPFVIIFFIAKSSLLLPGARQHFLANKTPTETEFSLLVKKYTEKSDKIIVYSFQNTQYLVSERLPASGHFFYLPWQEKYNENPKFGIKIDACKELSDHLPKIIYIDRWKVWDLYPWEDYASCIQNVVDNNYQHISGRPYYIRKDIDAIETRRP